MKTETSKWRVEEQDGASSRVLVVEASSWEAALESVWNTWELAHDLRRAGVEVGLSATQVFIRGTPQRYRVALERTPPKRTVPRPASSIPPAMPAAAAPAAAAPPAVPVRPAAKKAEPKKPLPRKTDALPSGRSLFGKLPRPSSPDLEDHVRPPPRASQPDPEEARRPLASEPELAAAPHPDPEPEPAPADESPAAAPSIVPTPVVDIGIGSAPPLARVAPSPVATGPVAPTASAQSPLPRGAAGPGAAAESARPAPAIDGRRLQVLVAGSVQLYTREQDPKNGAPVIYRQHGYALPMGTEEDEAEGFGRWMLEQMKRQVPEGSAPRLFHLAVYDEMFTGEPPVLALCKLEWKEWKDQINVSFPRRGDDSVVVDPPRARTPSMHPPDMGVAASPPGSPGAQAIKAQGRVAALFLPPVTPPSFAVQPPPRLPTGLGPEPAGNTPDSSSSED